MDQTTASAAMDSRKPAVRSVQLGSKAPNSSDANRDVCKRSYGGTRRQRDLERDGLVGGGGGCGPARGKAYGGPGKAGYGRSSNKVNRNKEKQSKQVNRQGLVSLDHYDDDDHYDSSERMRRPHQHLSDGARPYRSCVDYSERRGRAKKQRCSSSALYKTHTNERSFQARCQFLVNYKKEAEAVASASMPVGFTLPPPGAAVQSSAGSAVDPVASACPDQEGWMESVRTALSDPDSLVSWGSVEEVLLHTTEPFNCPVCLYPPVAPQVTKCGHIYCYPCILHYLALSDKKWRGCPICNLMVVREDLKSVVLVVHPDYRVGSSIQMRLMNRHRDSPLPVPVLAERQPSVVVPKHMFCRTMQASTEKVLAIIERERTALEVQMMTEGSEPEACFIEQALALLRERQQNLPDFGAEIRDQLSNLTLDDDAEPSLKSERESHLASKGKQTPANLSKEKDSKICSSQQANLANTGILVAPTAKNGEANPLHSEASKQSGLVNKDVTANRNRNASDSSTRSGTSGSDVSITSHISSLPVSSSQPLLGLRIPNEDSDDSSSISSSISNELIFSDVPTDVVSPETGSASENSCALSPTEISRSSFEEAAAAVTLDDCNIAGAIATPPSECLQFHLEDERSEKVAETVRKKQRSVDTPKAVHYFYQADDGSHVYLQPLNFAMLAREFGGAANCPTTISANIVEMEYGTMTDRSLMQGNRRFLCHLPLCCCYELVELDLKSLVSARILDSFKSSLDCREQARVQRAKKEQLIELRNREKEEKEFSGRLFQYVKSAYTGPPSDQRCDSGAIIGSPAATDFNEENYPAMGSSSGGRAHRHPVSSDGQSSPSLATSPPLSSAVAGRHHGRRKQQQQQQISFAKVLTTQTSSRSAQPQLALADGVLPSTASVWARPVRPAEPSSSGADAVDDDESHFSPPDYKHAFSMSLDTMITNALNANPTPGSGGKKNKKGKKKLKPVILSSWGGC
ncbi:Zinc finger C3HC4 RING-type [Trinorchestia longiramus]|nr:Zinc finger C3HC4 RING-type [Trinorchestia longiramus]